MGNGEYIIGRNSVKEAIRAGEQIDKIYVMQGITDGSIKQILRMAREARVVVVEAPRYKLDEMSIGIGHSGKPGNHQGIVAQVPAFAYGELEDSFALAEERKESLFLIILDSIQDPHNLGAIIRSAEALGAHGIIIGKHRSASLTSAVYKVSCGAAQYIPVIKVTNINQTIEELKERNVWAVAADMEGQPLSQTDLKGAIALVIGGEGGGVSRHTKDICDIVTKIEMTGNTQSLNAACAASIVIYEKRRQERV